MNQRLQGNNYNTSVQESLGPNIKPAHPRHDFDQLMECEEKNSLNRCQKYYVIFMFFNF